MTRPLFATTASGFETQLAHELRTLGGQQIRPGQGGVGLYGDDATIMKLCLWSRLASRLLWRIAKVPAENPTLFHAALMEIPWEEHLADGASLAVAFHGTNEALRNTQFGAMKVKDAVVDRFRNLGKERPSIHFEQPDLRIHVRLQGTGARISLDLSGTGLHRRGWRVSPSDASMKETLAAAILYLADWPTIAQAGGAFADLMCGAGTLPIEAAWMAADVAPGLKRPRFGFHTLPGFDQTDWPLLQAEARDRAHAGLSKLPPMVAWDNNPSVLKAARRNAEAAGVLTHIRFEQRAIEHQTTPTDLPAGLVVANPPYGERQGENPDALLFIYQTLGETLRYPFAAWHKAVFTARDQALHTLGATPTQRHALYNGPLPCQLWLYGPTQTQPHPPATPQTPFANRLKKNLSRMRRWTKKQAISCYRLYDADMPEYAVAIDIYGEWVHLQEYHAPKTIDPDKAKQRFAEVIAAIHTVLGTPANRLRIKVRRPQKGATQYGKQSDQAAHVVVTEGGLKFLINLTDYLDSGLFLDQRLLREKIRHMAHGKRFLNLFGYTGSATVYAADGGAKETVTVDLSQTYLAWAQRNLTLNGYTPGTQHRFISSDCIRWMRQNQETFDLIFLAPPTFSNSKRMAEPFDMVRDYKKTIARCSTLLAPGGTLLFVTHAKRFRMDPTQLPAELQYTDITAQTIPLDFQRKKAAFHHAWEMYRA